LTLLSSPSLPGLHKPPPFRNVLPRGRWNAVTHACQAVAAHSHAFAAHTIKIRCVGGGTKGDERQVVPPHSHQGNGVSLVAACDPYVAVVRQASIITVWYATLRGIHSHAQPRLWGVTCTIAHCMGGTNAPFTYNLGCLLDPPSPAPTSHTTARRKSPTSRKTLRISSFSRLVCCGCCWGCGGGCGEDGVKGWELCIWLDHQSPPKPNDPPPTHTHTPLILIPLIQFFCRRRHLCCTQFVAPFIKAQSVQIGIASFGEDDPDGLLSGHKLIRKYVASPHFASHLVASRRVTLPRAAAGHE
jgi:hypothetical protein